jgi:hypothetical protein
MEDIMHFAVEGQRQQFPGCVRRRIESPGLVVRVFRMLVAIEAATFLVAAALHVGAEIPLGFTVLSANHIVPATIVEGTAGILLAVAAAALFSRQAWAWTAALVAHIFSIFGVLLGITALAIRAGHVTGGGNAIYHRVILVFLVGGLVLLLRPEMRKALSDGQ